MKNNKHIAPVNGDIVIVSLITGYYFNAIYDEMTLNGLHCIVDNVWTFFPYSTIERISKGNK